MGRDRGLVLTVDIRRHGHQLFHAALPGTTPDNDTWIERKIRVVNRYGDSSFLVGRRLALGGKTLDEASGVEPILYAAHGGCFPIIVRDVGVVGTVTVSGLPQAEDHALVVEALESFLAVGREAPGADLGNRCSRRRRSHRGAETDDHAHWRFARSASPFSSGCCCSR